MKWLYWSVCLGIVNAVNICFVFWGLIFMPPSLEWTAPRVRLGFIWFWAFIVGR